MISAPWSPSNRIEINWHFRRLRLTHQEPARVFPNEALHSLQKHKTIMVSQREEWVAFRVTVRRAIIPLENVCMLVDIGNTLEVCNTLIVVWNTNYYTMFPRQCIETSTHLFRVVSWSVVHDSLHEARMVNGFIPRATVWRKATPTTAFEAYLASHSRDT